MPRSFDPRDKDLLAWLSSLAPRDELVARYAVMAMSQRCVQSPTWKARTAELRALLPLGVGEQAAVLRDANRMVAAFRASAAFDRVVGESLHPLALAPVHDRPFLLGTLPRVLLQLCPGR
jgi:hypothetical protein